MGNVHPYHPRVAPHDRPTDPDREGAGAHDAGAVAWSCVLDDTAAIWSSFLPWIATATELAGIDHARIYVHHACTLRPDIADLCRALGVNTRAVAPFDSRSPHTNKIRQCETDFADAGRVVLTDVDVAFTGPLPLAEIDRAVAGKPVDEPNPPIETLRDIFSTAGLPLPETCNRRWWNPDGSGAEFETVSGNFNGGLYVVDRALLAPIGQRWSHWAKWLLEREKLLGRWRYHVDQVGFCLAVNELRAPVRLLENDWNFPLHLKHASADREPRLLHHHALLDAHQRLRETTMPGAVFAVERVNVAIERFQRRYLDNRTFWNHRYVNDPDLGSGVGSRGEFLELKRSMLSRVAPGGAPLTILDWGCGDVEVVGALRWTDYHGVDSSVEALRIARGRRPDWRFSTPAEFDSQDGRPRNFVLCLDVLIHQRDRDEYVGLLRRILRLARRGVLVSGYDRAPALRSFITFFHEPLGQTLASLDEAGGALLLGEYRDTSLYFVAAADEAFDPSAAGEPIETARGIVLGRSRAVVRSRVPGAGRTNRETAPAYAGRTGHQGPQRRRMTHPLSPTARLLFLCARTQLTAETRERIAKSADDDIDWDGLFRASSKNRVEPLVFRALNECCPEAVPEETAGRMRERLDAKVVRNRVNLDVFLEGFALFAEHGIPVIPMKGVTFALGVYGDLALRHVGDVDLLVRRRDYLRAKNLLIRNGYRQETFGDVETLAAQATLMRDDGRPGIDLHYEVTQLGQHGRAPAESLVPGVDSRDWIRLDTSLTRWFFSLDTAPLWDRLGSLRIGEFDVPVLSPEDLLAVASVHGIKENWRCLNRVCDIAELLRAHPDLDWDRVFDQWLGLRSEKKLSLGLLLANRVLDAPLPGEVARRAARSASVRSLMLATRHRLGQPGHLPGIEESRLVSALFTMDNLRDRIRYLRYVRRRLGDFNYRPMQYLEFCGRVMRQAGSTLSHAVRPSAIDR